VRNVFSGRESVYWHTELMFFSDLSRFTLNGTETVGITDIVI
jgi:hypothetical protein